MSVKLENRIYGVQMSANITATTTLPDGSLPVQYMIPTKRKRDDAVIVTPSRLDCLAPSLPRENGRLQMYPTTLMRLTDQLQRDEQMHYLEQPECKNNDCPFCRGCLMSQRYNVASRLARLENLLYGKQISPQFEDAEHR